MRATYHFESMSHVIEDEDDGDFWLQGWVHPHIKGPRLRWVSVCAGTAREDKPFLPENWMVVTFPASDAALS